MVVRSARKKLNSSPKERKKEKEEHGKLADGTRMLFWPPISPHDGRTVTVASRVIKNNASPSPMKGYLCLSLLGPITLGSSELGENKGVIGK